MKTILFYYRHLDIGGCELLIERIAKEIIRNEYKTILICNSISNEMEKRLDSIKCDIVKLQEWNNKKKVRRLLSEREYELSDVICFTFNDYVCLSQMNVNCLWYAVHYKALALGLEISNTFVQKIYKNMAHRIIKSGRNANRICVMDEETILFTNNYYEEDYLYPIVRLPIDPINICDNQIKKKDKVGSRKILTIARADYPFKGYVIGLIDYLNQNVNEFVELTIISYGKDRKVLEEKIGKVNNKKLTIKLIDKVDYSLLENYYRDTELYIGMGTTIFDAANRGIVSIPVKPYTYDLVADKFFHDDFTKCSVDNIEKNNIDELVESFLSASEDQLLNWSVLNRQLVSEHYMTNVVVMKILNMFSETSETKGLHMNMIASFILGCKAKIMR